MWFGAQGLAQGRSAADRAGRSHTRQGTFQGSPGRWGPRIRPSSPHPAPETWNKERTSLVVRVGPGRRQGTLGCPAEARGGEGREEASRVPPAVASGRESRGSMSFNLRLDTFQQHIPESNVPSTRFPLDPTPVAEPNGLRLGPTTRPNGPFGCLDGGFPPAQRSQAPGAWRRSIWRGRDTD